MVALEQAAASGVDEACTDSWLGQAEAALEIAMDCAEGHADENDTVTLQVEEVHS